jgi:hypothetical protein
MTTKDISVDELYVAVIDRMRRKGKDLSTFNMQVLYAVLDTKKFKHLSMQDLVTIIINRCEQTKRRLAHNTGAENWL